MNSARIAQPGADAVDRGGNGAIELRRVGFAVCRCRALAADEFDLDERHGIDVRIAQADGAVEHRVGFEQRFLLRDLENHAVSQVELGFERREDTVAQRFVFNQRSVEAGDAEVGLGESHLDVANDVEEEREFASHGLELLQPVGGRSG